MTQLVFTGPFPEERIVEMTGPELVIGRDETCDLVIDDARISRRHARIVWRLVLEDLGSTNGVWSGGRRVQSAILEPNEKLCVGGAERYFLCVHAPEEYPAPDDETLESATVFLPAHPVTAGSEKVARLEQENRELRDELGRITKETPSVEESARLRKENRFLFERIRELEARLDAAERIRQESEDHLAKLLGREDSDPMEDSVTPELQTRFLAEPGGDEELDDPLEAETAFSLERVKAMGEPEPAADLLRNELAEVLSAGRCLASARPKFDRDLVLLVRKLQDFALELESPERPRLIPATTKALERGTPEDWQALHEVFESLKTSTHGDSTVRQKVLLEWSQRLLGRLAPTSLRRELELPLTGRLDPKASAQVYQRYERLIEDLEPDLLVDELEELLRR
ncbi:MAG: FHA domain-containing protein [Planctomycetota bacterium]